MNGSFHLDFISTSVEDYSDSLVLDFLSSAEFFCWHGKFQPGYRVSKGARCSFCSNSSGGSH